MRVLSLNAWGGAVFDELAAWLPSVGADVICLQEVTRTRSLTDWTTFQDTERTLPQRANLFDDISELLPNHRAHFVASDAGPVTDAGGNVHRQEFGLATFVIEPVRTLDEQSTFVHGSFVEHQAWAIADRPRAIHAVRVLDAAATTPTVIAHLHGLRDPGGKGDTPARAQQANAIAAFIDDVRSAGDTAVFCGDLNLLPDSGTFAVMAEIGMVDLVGTASTRTSLYPKPLEHANYLLVSDPARVKSFEIIRTPEVSDHCALLLEL
jgi:endonuclease/exonuclease/phosphatase family metal-dependent hydrolase